MRRKLKEMLKMRNPLEVKIRLLFGEITELQREIEVTYANRNNSSWSDRQTRQYDNELASLEKEYDSKLSLLEALTR
jgi:predicted RNase H-like nuclease (RuvC/YqgF family)